MKLTQTQREWLDIGAITVAVGGWLYYGAKADELVSDPTSAEKQATAANAKTLAFAATAAGGVAALVARR